MKKFFIILGLALSVSQVTAGNIISLNAVTNTLSVHIVYSNACYLNSVSLINSANTNATSWMKIYDTYTNSVIYTNLAYTNVTFALSTTNASLYWKGGTNTYDNLNRGEYLTPLGPTNLISFPLGQLMFATTNIVAGAGVTFPLKTFLPITTNVIAYTWTFDPPLEFKNGVGVTNNIGAAAPGAGNIQLMFDVSPRER